MRHAPIATVVGVVGLGLLAAALTVASYISLFLPEDRGQAWLVGLLASCVAEMVLAIYVAATQAAEPGTGPDVANRQRIGALLTVWVVAVLLLSGYAAHPAHADTFLSDQALIIQLALSLLVFFGCFFQHRQAVAVQNQETKAEHERGRLQRYAGGVDNLQSDLKALTGRPGTEAKALDRLRTRVDTLRSSLLAVSPMGEPDGVEAGRADAAIEASLTVLHDRVADLMATEDVAVTASRLAAVFEAVDQAIDAVRHRESTASFAERRA